MTDKAQRKILIEWKRSGIGFTRRQRASIRGLGLRRLHHIVEREDTMQVRGLVNAVPHLVEILTESVKLPAWAAIPEYTVHAKPAAPERETPAAPTATFQESGEAKVSTSPKPEAKPSKKEKTVKAEKGSAAKGKTAKAAKKPEKKKAKAAEKPAKAKSTKGKK